MSEIYSLLASVVLLALGTRFEPIRGWWLSTLRERYLVSFWFPFLIITGWPAVTGDAYLEGQDLGWQRIARILLFAGFATSFLAMLISRRPLAIPRLRSIRVFAVYSVVCALSTFWSPEPVQTLWKAFELFALLLIITELYQSKTNSGCRAIQIAGTLMFLSFSLCVTALVGAVVAPQIAWAYQDAYGESGLRGLTGVAPMINANMLGQLGATVALVGALRIAVASGGHYRGDFVVLGVGIVTLALAYARTSMIAMVILSFFLLVTLRRSRWIFTALILTLVAVIIFPGELMTYFARGQTEEQFVGLTGRTYRWEAALAGFWEHPWLGHGFFVGHKYVLSGGGHYYATTDSTYVETLVNLGVTGFVLVVFFAVQASAEAWQSLWRLRLACGELRNAALVFCVFVGFIVFRSFTASSFQVLHYNLVFILVVLTGVALLRRTLRTADRAGLRY